MFCSINKWMISRALDTGKPISGRVKNHLQRCDACREFATFCASLEPKFVQDKNAIFERSPETLTKKIMSTIPEDFNAESAIGHKTLIRKMVERRPALIPSLSAALVILGILSSVLFLTHPRSQDADSLGQLTALIKSASPEDVLSRMESPLETEYRELKQALDSTTRYLFSSLEFRLGQQAK
jgi:hypothetical protein